VKENKILKVLSRVCLWHSNLLNISNLGPIKMNQLFLVLQKVSKFSEICSRSNLLIAKSILNFVFNFLMQQYAAQKLSMKVHVNFPSTFECSYWLIVWRSLELWRSIFFKRRLFLPLLCRHTNVSKAKFSNDVLMGFEGWTIIVSMYLSGSLY